MLKIITEINSKFLNAVLYWLCNEGMVSRITERTLSEIKVINAISTVRFNESFLVLGPSISNVRFLMVCIALLGEGLIFQPKSYFILNRVFHILETSRSNNSECYGEGWNDKRPIAFTCHFL